jgi:hypothetical protein
MQERHLNLGISELIAQISIRVFFHVVRCLLLRHWPLHPHGPVKTRVPFFLAHLQEPQEKKRPNP